MADLSYACEEPDGEHSFPEADIIEDDPPPGVLRAGMKIVMPCEYCGMTPLEQMNALGEHFKEKDKALNALLVHKDIPLYHWSPVARRKQVIRYGLRPRMRPNVNLGEDFRLSEICLGADPVIAWLLSGGQRHAVAGTWDLWVTRSSLLQEPNVLGSHIEPNGIHEVRTAHRIYKRDLWYVASRERD